MALKICKAAAVLQSGMKVKASSRMFEIIIDEPLSIGGTDEGMTPSELVLCALGACQSILAGLYARKLRIQLDHFRVELEGELDTDGYKQTAGVRPGYSQIRYNVHIKTNASKEKVEQLLHWIERSCPVGDTLANPVQIGLNHVFIESGET
jgi:uncharacterized OsmC-like protein